MFICLLTLAGWLAGFYLPCLQVTISWHSELGLKDVINCFMRFSL